MKLEMEEFDFKTALKKDCLPDAIVFMTHGVRRNIIRFSDLLLLYVQKRQFNKIGWPYIGSVIITNDNKVGVTHKAVVLFEANKINEWIV